MRSRALRGCRIAIASYPTHAPVPRTRRWAFNRSAVGTVVERKTRFVILSKMRGCTADAALEGFTRQMKRLPAMMRRSMTYDRGSEMGGSEMGGSEMACHPELARRLKIDIWFCDPQARRPAGHAAATRTPTACCASSSPRAPI